MLEGFLVIGRLQMPREITSMSTVGSNRKHAEKHNRHMKENTISCNSRLHGQEHNLALKDSGNP